MKNLIKILIALMMMVCILSFYNITNATEGGLNTTTGGTTSSSDPTSTNTEGSISEGNTVKQTNSVTEGNTETNTITNTITTNTTKKVTTTKKATTSKKATTKPSSSAAPVNTENLIVIEEVETPSIPFGISVLKLYAINDKDEKEELTLNPEFKIDTYVYEVNVDSTVKTVEIEKEANEFNDLVKVEGLENELLSGENIVKLTMVKEDGTEVTYTIKVIKAEPKKPREKIILNIQLECFITIVLVIIGITILITVFVKDKIEQKKRWENALR